MGCGIASISSQSPSVLYDGTVIVPASGSVWLAVTAGVLVPMGEWETTNFSRIAGRFFSDVTNAFSVRIYQYRVPTTGGGTQVCDVVLNSAPDPVAGIEMVNVLEDVHGKILAVQVVDAVAGGVGFTVQSYLTLRPV